MIIIRPHRSLACRWASSAIPLTEMSEHLCPSVAEMSEHRRPIQPTCPNPGAAPDRDVRAFAVPDVRTHRPDLSQMSELFVRQIEEMWSRCPNAGRVCSVRTSDNLATHFWEARHVEKRQDVLFAAAHQNWPRCPNTGSQDVRMPLKLEASDPKRDAIRRTFTDISATRGQKACTGSDNWVSRGKTATSRAIRVPILGHLGQCRGEGPGSAAQPYSGLRTSGWEDSLWGIIQGVCDSPRAPPDLFLA